MDSRAASRRVVIWVFTIYAMTRSENAIVPPTWAPGDAITGGILGTQGLIPNNPHSGRYVVPLQENNPSVPRSDALRWKEVPAEIPTGCSPKKRLPPRSTARGYRNASLFYHKLLFLAADQSRNRIISAHANQFMSI